MHDGRADKDSYPHDCRADKCPFFVPINAPYRHDRRADKNPYRHDRNMRFSSKLYYALFSIFLLMGDRRQTKQFCFLDADCLVVGESQSSSRRSPVGGTRNHRYPVKPPVLMVSFL